MGAISNKQSAIQAQRKSFHTFSTAKFYLLQLSNQPEDQSPTIKVKLSGDGARMSHSINLFVCSFSILDEGQNVLSSAGTYMHLFINSRASFLKIEIPNR